MRASGAHVVDASSVTEILRQAHLPNRRHAWALVQAGRCSWDDAAVCSLHCPVGSSSAVPQSARVRRPTPARRCARRAPLAAVGCANTPACRNVHQWEKRAPPHLQPPARTQCARFAIDAVRLFGTVGLRPSASHPHTPSPCTPSAISNRRLAPRRRRSPAVRANVWPRASQRAQRRREGGWAPRAAVGLPRPLTRRTSPLQSAAARRLICPRPTACSASCGARARVRVVRACACVRVCARGCLRACACVCTRVCARGNA